jgi:disulfide bond formation protein DsbB
MSSFVRELSRTSPAAGAALAIAAGGLVTIAGAWFFQYGVGLNPCPLCLEQRIAYYVVIPLAALIMLGASVNSSPRVLLLALIAIAVAMLWNAGLGAYHAGVEWKLWEGPRDCSGPVTNFGNAGDLLRQMQTTSVVRCDEAAWRFLGLSLAGYNVLISLGLAVIALWGAWAQMKAPEKSEVSP